MKLLTLNFLTCARKTCKQTASAFPLHPKDAELEQIELELNPLFIRNVVPRLDWDVMRGLAAELGLPSLPETLPTQESIADDDSQTLRDLHTLLIETGVREGKLVCANCGHEYAVKEGIANFLLPSHLV
ncbi:hypothetical protein AAFC00_003830 [Neodothiora populina]|uniref:Trm112p-like protein n=1 Tax=Neodothiora populina TaxID=2781224 RepID=A0ABR3PGR0_9PEZI